MFQTSSSTVLSLPATYAEGATTQNYVSAAMMALILYEHGITLPEEVKFIWHHKRSWATVLFLVNRYAVLAYGVLAVVSSFVDGHWSCEALTRATEALVLWLMLIFGICSSLRVYVLWNKNLPFFSVVLALNLVPVVANTYLYSFVRPSLTPVSFASCVSYMPLTGPEQIRMIAAARVSTIVVDTIVLTVTLIKTWQTQLYARKSQITVPLTTMLIRDGTTYFITVLAMNIAQLIVFQLTEQVYLISFICSLTAILISRFLLDLREVAMCGNNALGMDSTVTTKSEPRMPSKVQRRPREEYELSDLWSGDDANIPRHEEDRVTLVIRENDADEINEEARNDAVNVV